MSAKPESRSSREFARIEVELGGRCSILDEKTANDLKEEILCSPTVWTLRDEATLRDLASGGGKGHDALLAQAVLDLTDQVVRLRSRLTEIGGPTHPVTILQLSGGGGQITSRAPLEKGTLLSIHLDPDDAPPVLVLAEIMHFLPDPPPRYGFRFFAIHPKDQDRLIRYLYEVQRRAIRARQDESES